MNNANTQIYDKVVDRAAMLRLYEARTSQKVELIIDGHALRVDKLVKESKLQGKDFNGFLKDLDDEIIKTMADSHNVSSRSLLDLFSDQVGYTSKTLNSAIGDIWRVQPPPRHIAEDIVLKQPLYSNTTLDKGWAGIGKQERIRLESLIRKGIAEGQTNNAIADTLMNEGYKATKSQARGLVVTATTSVYAQADHQVYKANEKALQGYQYIAVLDSRTTPLCAHRDGNIYPITDTEHLPPAHWHCRSTTVPVVKNYEDFAKMEGIAEIRKRNFAALTPKEITQYDGQTPMRESYDQWLRRQPKEVQLRHLGDINKLELFRSGQVTLDKFSAPSGASVGIRELKQMTESGFGVPGDTRRFALAKEKLDTLKLGAARPEEIYESADMRKALEEYYRLQAGELDGTLSFTNYRGTLLHNKKNTRNRVLASPPREENLKFNPITGRYDDSRMYQPSPSTLANTYKLVQESEALKEVDKKFIIDFVDGLQDKIGVNERAVITDNLRITIGRFRENKEPWVNLKAVLNGQMKFDVMNVSSYMETQLRKDANLLLRLKQDNYIDPVLGPTQLQQLHDTFLKNIMLKNKWEDRTAIKIGKELRNVLDYKLPFKIRNRLDDKTLDQFYLRFAKRLGLADTPDRDQFAIALGRDLYNAANYRGSRNEWYKLGVKILDDAKDKGFYELETFGVQKRRMKSRMGGKYFGPYYDTFSVNIRVVDPRIVEYAKLTRKVDIGLRIGVTTDKNRLVIREGYKTYFIDNGLLGMVDTRIPITSTSSFGTFPASVIDKSMADALNWSAQAKYKIDPEFHDFVEKLLNFQDDKGKAQFYHDLNKYREFIVERGDAYERFKAMKWLRNKDAAFSNHPFLDHRGRIYERGFIGPQSGETFRPFLNTEDAKPLGEMGFLNFQDQIGSFLGGASDVLEDRYNSLSVIGRQQIAQLWRKDMVALGRNMLRGKPGDIRAVLESPLMAEIDGEEQGKLMRLALEAAKIDDFLGGDYSEESLKRLASYKTALALEQDASSSGAQIIALTTRNRQLAELSNVVPTNQKQRLYDEIAAATFNDPRFIELNKRLNLTEKDLRKAAKAYFWAFKNPVNSVKLLLKKDNTEPSLPWEGFEGVTTKVYDLEQIMKLVGQKSARSAGQMVSNHLKR
jgi:SPP1 gp7 family putative phage head morphogenesis protein